MKYFKLFDIGIQVMLTIVAIVVFNEYSFALFYFGVGSWQVVSCIIHLIVYPTIERTRRRKGYELTLAWVLGVAAVSGVLFCMGLEVAGGVLYFEGCVMLLGGIAMTIWYCAACVGETVDLFNGAEMNDKDYVETREHL